MTLKAITLLKIQRVIKVVQYSTIYGNDIASYSYKLKILNTDTSFLRNLTSGGLLQADSLQLLSVSGNTLFVAINGIFEIKDVLLVGEPSQEFQIKAYTSNGINSENIKLFEPNFDSTLIIDIYLRDCLPGEVLIQNQTCNLCPANMKCDGGNILQVNRNYWRSSLNTTSIFKCPKVGVCLYDIKVDSVQNAQKTLMEIIMLEVVSMIAQNVFHLQSRYLY
ncbi:UNKNOWN [Stylonychia lemnae]|uniref:Uncharacterized protein n=1 Tax=Stylonychia lemnae TaxID=5949 RepID=A0A078AVF6_STYLE|nr:UNKNOWN [Stylonychia lemnae]|eukprot:CDW85257.1 UNKNOWN [Stylonychia lemnae]